MSYVKKLYRSRSNRMVAGVCGGIAERVGADPTLIRLAWAIASLFLFWGLGGLILYVVSAIIIPDEPTHIDI